MKFMKLWRHKRLTRCQAKSTVNDSGVAVANSLAAVKAGARQVQGTLNGLGERCGNADLITLGSNSDVEAGLSDQYSKR